MKKEYDWTRAKRASFRGLPPIGELDRRTKVRITIMIDADVLQHFKAKAATLGAAPYQTQINRALREHLVEGPSRQQKDLLDDQDFVSRLAERLAAYSTSKPTRPRSRRRAPTATA